ncbi:MAG: NAD(P)/FAD-dependent oxidoreductase [Candidatus Caldarchaeales archaeon]|nr:NAD(P)/FAD-dependent oxidoreductase [Candidatus Caldarchaeales archaeon]
MVINRVAIAGGGVAGSYLATLLDGHTDVTVFERQKKEKFRAICAWATSKYEMRRHASRAGLSFDEYILHEGREMLVQLPDEIMSIKLKGLCTFDKKRLILDLHRRLKIVYDVDARGLAQSEYDLIVDATGFHRVLLPRIRRDYYIPTTEYLVRFRDPPFDDFYLKPFYKLAGYLWYFPLEKGYAHVGAGDYLNRQRPELDAFTKKYGGEVVEIVGRPVRIASPAQCEPIWSGKAVGVGECIGAVHPVTGEGIIPAIECANILSETLEQGLESYRRRVLRDFDAYYKTFMFLRKVHRGEFSFLRDFHLILFPYLYMKRREERFGMEILLRQWFKILSSYMRARHSPGVP